VHYHTNIINHGIKPAVIAAGLTVPKRDRDGNAVLGKDGQPVLQAKYSGLHCLRHFYASWCINRVEDGGLGLPPKTVQELLGHASIVMTLDRYGHLFPRGDDRHALDAAERALLA
jgi:integrase